MQDRNNVLLQEEQLGTEVLKPRAMWFSRRRQWNQKFWIGKLWGPARNVRGKTQKFWVVFRQWATSQKFRITLKQWGDINSSVCYQHVKIRNSECLKTASGNIRSSVYLTCKENSEALCCIKIVSEHQKFSIMLSQWVSIRSSVCVNSEKNHGNSVWQNSEEDSEVPHA